MFFPSLNSVRFSKRARNDFSFAVCILSGEPLCSVMESSFYFNDFELFSALSYTSSSKIGSLPKKVEIIEKFENDKRDTQPVPLINFENDLTTSPNKIHSETDPKSDEQQQNHDNKQQIPSKELSENSKEKDGNNSQFLLLMV